MTNAFKFDPFSVVFILLNSPGLDKLRTKKRKARKLLNHQADKIVANAAKEPQTDNTKVSVLSAMIHAQCKGSEGEKLSLDEIRDEVKTFVLAGHETTSTWCYWALYVLAKHPDIQEKVYRDVIEHSSSQSVDELTVQQTETMEYFGAFMLEVIRLYPPAGIIFRVNQEAEDLGEVTVPPNTRIAISPHILHRHPKYWDDPEEFKPERWINILQKEAERRRFAFIPFSTGGRNCIGQKFATMEAYLIVAAVVRAFTIEIAPSQKDVEHTFTSQITMKAKPGLYLAVKKRHGW